jgi:two-component system, LytTR family, sensor kinase
MSRYWLFQLIGWTGMVLVEMFNYGVAVRWIYDWRFILFFMAYPVFGIVTSHLLRKSLNAMDVFNEKKSRVLFYAISSFVIWTLVLGFAVQIPEIIADAKSFFEMNSVEIALLNLVNLARYTIVWITIYFLYKVLNKASSLELEKLESQKVAKEFELNLLKTQLNPHFLFNALNSIKALVIIDRENARDGIVKLSEILRFSLTSSSKETIPTFEELYIVQKYLEVEKLRFGQRLHFSIECGQDAMNESLPVGVILSLVENAIKHGVSKLDGDTEVSVKFFKNQDGIEIVVLNTGSLNQLDLRKGIGTQFVQRRLESVYNSVQLEMQQLGHLVRVKVDAQYAKV